MTGRATQNLGAGWAGPALCAILAFASFLAMIQSGLAHGGLILEDDAYYYLLTARHLARAGVSSFDLQSQTNGYHPLWLLLVAVLDRTVGSEPLQVLVTEATLLALALGLVLRVSPVRSIALQLGFGLVFVWTCARFALRGMEVSLFAFGLGLFVAALARARGRAGGLVLGLAASVCIGARIDAAFFVLPALMAAPASRRTQIVAASVVAALGAAYALANLALFGMAMPVSSTIKSLGGLQINHPLLAQLTASFDGRGYRSYALTAATLFASSLLIPITRGGSVARSLAFGSAVGGLLYCAKLVFLSSWVVWPWYNFAALFPLFAALFTLGPFVEAGTRRLWRRVAGDRGGAVMTRGAAFAMGLAFVATGLSALARPVWVSPGYAAIDRLALARYGAVLGGQPVAMGDRAGGIAAGYPGPLVQLEGLVGDKPYLQAVKAAEDVRPLLCRRGVRFVLDYEPDLGDYQSLGIRVFRSFLTQARGPTLTVWRADEVGHVSDLALYDNRRDHGIGDSTLYVWRLRCADLAAPNVR